MSAGYISKKKGKKDSILHWSHSLLHIAGTNSVDPVGNLMQIVRWVVNWNIPSIYGSWAEQAWNGFLFLPQVPTSYTAAHKHGKSLPRYTSRYKQ